MFTSKINVYCDHCDDLKEVSYILEITPQQMGKKPYLKVEHFEELIPKGWVFVKSSNKMLCKDCYTQYDLEHKNDHCDGHYIPPNIIESFKE